MRSASNHIQPRPSITAMLLPDDGAIPNNPELPLLIYQDALHFNGNNAPAVGNNAPAVCEQLLAANGWGNSWRNGIYPFHHYHSTAHEALFIAGGRASVQLGGEEGITLAIVAGDVLILPAGMGHKNLGSSRDLLVVGAYPPGQHWDLCYGKPGERPGVLSNIAAVPLPQSDPVYGLDGPLIKHWG